METFIFLAFTYHLFGFNSKLYLDEEESETYIFYFLQLKKTITNNSSCTRKKKKSQNLTEPRF